MKSYTDLEQSKKLQEILPLDSADMAYWKRSYRPNDYAITAHHTKELQEGFEAKGIEYIPCWSLAALMEILNGAAFTRDGTAPECYEATIFYTDEPPKLKRMTCTGTSFVDVCFKMIIKLNEMNILTLPKTTEEQS